MMNTESVHFVNLSHLIQTNGLHIIHRPTHINRSHLIQVTYDTDPQVTSDTNLQVTSDTDPQVTSDTDPQVTSDTDP